METSGGSLTQPTWGGPYLSRWRQPSGLPWRAFSHFWSPSSLLAAAACLTAAVHPSTGASGLWGWASETRLP